MNPWLRTVPGAATRRATAPDPTRETVTVTPDRAPAPVRDAHGGAAHVGPAPAGCACPVGACYLHHAHVPHLPGCAHGCGARLIHCAGCWPPGRRWHPGLGWQPYAPTPWPMITYTGHTTTTNAVQITSTR